MMASCNRWMLEKYDGVRGFWNPLKKAFYSRHGNRLTFPQHLIDSMPTDIFLDGEIWYIYIYILLNLRAEQASHCLVLTGLEGTGFRNP